MSYNQSIILKGIAIILVLIAHVVALFGIRYATPLGGIGVAIFLILSGYGLYKSVEKNGLDNFWKKRLSKVIIPYIVIVIINAIFYQESFSNIFLQSILIELPTSMLWFIQFIVMNYIAFYVINRLFKPDTKQYWISFMVVAILFFVYGNSLIAEQAPAFLIGMFFAAEKIKFKNSKFKLLLVSMIFLTLSVIMLITKQFEVIRTAPELFYYLVEMGIKVFGALSITLFVKSDFKIFPNNILIFSGKISYEIYLVHVLTLPIILAIPTMINVVIFLIITLTISILFNKVLSFIFIKGRI